MPITAANLFASVGLTITGKARWGQSIPCDDPGVYAVCLSDDPARNAQLLLTAPLCPIVVREWVEYVPTFALNGRLRPDPQDVASFLARSWLPDENIVYIGKATCLKDRLGQFRRHRIGDRRPHAGGHWLKALKNMGDLHIFFCSCPSVAVAEEREQKAIDVFAQQVSPATRQRLYNPQVPIPFANRIDAKGVRKQQVIGGDVRRG